MILTGERREYWKCIVGFENYYFISTLGRVASKSRRVNYSNGRTVFHKGRVLKPYTSATTGYLYVDFNINGKRFKKTIHSLVATAFVDGKKPGLEVNHKDGKKQNNIPKNLEWVTRSQNVIHAYETGLINRSS